MPETVSFPITFDDDANALLAHDPLALLYGMLLDQQVPMTWAFKSPLVIKERLGDRWSPSGIATLDPEDLVALFCEKPAVHRYPAAMARRAHAIAVEVGEGYDGDTAAIWGAARAGA
ncbi:MAG TPA: Fe-S cluster assembly protein HesB, partial [Acidimicrobiales bacterium]|nr:Fe-S cluster assembly protein HesB [Acidimicrobiales bacterium]